MFWSFDCKTCGILVLWPEIESPPPALEDEVLTTGPLGKSLSWAICHQLWQASIPQNCSLWLPREGRLNGLFPTLTPINFFGNIPSPLPPYLHHPSGETLFWWPLTSVSRASRWLSGKESACQCSRCRRCGSSWVGKILWRRKWQSAPGF